MISAFFVPFLDSKKLGEEPKHQQKIKADLLSFCRFVVLHLLMIPTGKDQTKFGRKRTVFKFLHNPNTKWSHAYHSVVCSILCTHAIMQNFYLDFEKYRDYYFISMIRNQTWSQLIDSGVLKPTSERSLDGVILAVDGSLSGLEFLFLFAVHLNFFLLQHFSFWRFPFVCGPRRTFLPTLVA